MFAEFKKFAMRGNVMDLAVGVIIGGAFGKIIGSMVNDMLMPIIGMLMGGINFLDLKYVIKEATETASESAILYGQFLQSIIDFILIALSVFFLVKFIQSLRQKEEEKPAPPPEPSAETLLLQEIRDILKTQS
jgi:large conductance mechanosensitive channel